MKLDQRTDGWWITEVPDSVTECGPYDNKRSAQEDMRGLIKTFRAWRDNDHGYFTTTQTGDGFKAKSRVRSVYSPADYRGADEAKKEAISVAATVITTQRELF